MTAGRQTMLARLAELGVRGWSVNGASVMPATDVADAAFAAAVVAVAAESLAAGEIVFHVEHSDLVALPWTDGAVVADLAGLDEVSRGRLIATLRHFHADLRRAETDAVSIDGFTRQLSQSYEEVNLVYRMARLLTSHAAPAAVAGDMCRELRATLGYGWLAMAFGDTAGVLPELRRTLASAGELPCDAAAFAGLVPAADAGRVLTAATSALAARSGSEVLAEPVSGDGDAVGMLLAGNRQGVDPDVSSNELQLVQAAAGFLGLYHQNALRFAEQREQFLGTLKALSAAVDAKDPYTRGHSDRVALLGWQLATALGYDADAAEAVRVAGLLHDIGKIGVPELVLRKPTRLNDAEFAEIKKHPATGYHILKDIPSLAAQLPGVLHHHERWDGRGYPHGLKAEAIPPVARILAFADTFDAMSSSRAYRKGLERGHVLAEIGKSGGTQFDPAMVEAFVTLDFAEFDRMLAVQTEQDVAAVAA